MDLLSPFEEPNGASGPVGIRELADHVAPLSAKVTVEEASNRFKEDASLLALPVLEGDRPLGLVNRHAFLTELAQPFGWALFARKPITSLMNSEPLCVDVTTSISSLGATLTRDHPAALQAGFIIVDQGRYVGLANATAVVARFARDLKEQKGRAEEANRAKSHFLATMSHELRTPLNAILGFTDIIRTRALGETRHAREQYKAYLDDVFASASHLTDLISDLLDISRIEAGTFNFKLETLSAAEMVEDALQMLRMNAQKQGIALISRLDDGPLVSGDRRGLLQILVNLGTNAIKFSPTGTQVRFEMTQDDDRVLFSVIDEGPGFAATKDPTDPDLASKKGAGIGLALCRKLAGLMDGHLSADDAPEGGARVELSLPLLALADDAPQPSLDDAVVAAVA
ncbi:MAG: ATP-binding protein [Pseudomonadota bacterium]